MASNLKRPGSAAQIVDQDPSTQYEVLEKIGQGSFGIIRKVRHKETGEILARKEISYASMSQREREQLWAEIQVLEKLKHSNIVRYVSRNHVKSSNELHLYMEYCSSGDLGGHIKRLLRDNRYADESFVWSVVAQLVGALYRCHTGKEASPPGKESELIKGAKPTAALQRKDDTQQIILHRDLKPENVFLTNGSTVKLGDFGLSRIIAAHDFASTYVGTPFYMSPEICSSERYSGKSDVWSLGCIIYELCACEPPFNARNHLELIQKIRAGRLKPLPSCFSRELGAVVQSCLKVNPDERPDTAQLLSVPGIKLARMKLESEMAFARGNLEREGLVEKLKRAEKENQALREEVTRLKGAEKQLEMQWHAKATLAITQHVEQQVEAEKQKLLKVFAAEVERKTDEKLAAHFASLPVTQLGEQPQGITLSVRSSTPPPEVRGSSFATTGTTAPTTASSMARTIDGDLETDLTSLSLGDETSPLAQRMKPAPRKSARTPFTRAKTLANPIMAGSDSPMDVQMADPSPTHPNSLRGLALSPRREGKAREGLLGQGIRRNIFAQAADLRPRSNLNIASSVPDSSGLDDADNSFADDILEDDDELAESPSRPTSGQSNFGTGSFGSGDPFKALTAPAPTMAAGMLRKPGQRPSLSRQQTMPVQMPQSKGPARRTNVFSKAGATTATTTTTTFNKENRPPSSHARTNSSVPVLTTSPQRTAAAPKKELTPNRQAPRAPLNKTPLGGAAARNLMKHAQRNAGALQGRTLIELSQGPAMASAPSLLPSSPAKWDPSSLGDGECMPSPFLRKTRA